MMWIDMITFWIVPTKLMLMMTLTEMMSNRSKYFNFKFDSLLSKLIINL